MTWIGIILLIGAAGAGAALPELPRAYVDTTMPAITGNTYTVNAGGNLQATIDQAAAADPNLNHLIVVQAGATFQGRFLLRARAAGTGWIVLRTSNIAGLPADGNRASPADSSNMPKMLSDNTGNTGDAVTTDAGAHHYRLVGMELAAHPTVGTANLVTINGADHIVFDRCYMHGNPNGGTRRAVALNGDALAVIDSYISDFKDPSNDTQALWAVSSRGPLKIINNYLEAAGENVMFGGAQPPDAAHVPQDIEIRNNLFSKPLAWRGSWVIKNLLELKLGIRVLMEGNIFENLWAQNQGGAALVWTVRNEYGSAPYAEVSNITFRYNIVRHVNQGLAMFGSDDNAWTPPTSQQEKLIDVHDNLFWDLGGSWGAQGAANGQFLSIGNGGTYLMADVAFNHNTVLQPGTLLNVSRAGHTGFVFQNNIIGNGQYGVCCGGTPLQTLNAYFPGYIFTKNAIMDTQAAGYNNPSWWPAGNFFPTNANSVGFIDLVNSDYHLSASSLYKNAGTDGKDLGADIDAINAATACAGSGTCGAPPPPAVTMSPARPKGLRLQ